MTGSPPPSRRAFPTQLGRYDIVERLSAGGMGEVFLARFVGPGGFVKPVALKRVHPHLADDPSFIDMLHDEANVASAVHHPNIVKTIDVGAEGGNHFVVVEYVSGDPLTRVVRELKAKDRKMPRWVAAWIGAQIASALHAVHEAKTLAGEPLEIVHRDVSCANVMLSDAGHPMLFDFGIAKARQRLAQNTMTGALKGKLTYMAPETFRGVKPTRSVDIFGLGVVLYELLTNVSPYQRENELETLMALQNDDVAPPSEVRGGAPDPALDAIVMRAMARDREDRYPTAEALERALREWASRTGVPHDAATVAAWLAAELPDRIAAREQLLAKLAQPAAPRAMSDEASSPGSGSRRPLRLDEITESGSSVGDGLMTRTPPPLTRTERPPREKKRGLLAAGVGLAIGALTALFVFTRHAPRDGDARTNAQPSAPSVEATSAVIVAPPPPSAPEPVHIVQAPAPAATAIDFDALPNVTAQPAPPARPQPRVAREDPKPAATAKPSEKATDPAKKGPLVRNYEP